MHVQQGQQSYTGGSLHGKGRQHSSCCHGPRLPGGVAGDQAGLSLPPTSGSSGAGLALALSTISGRPGSLASPTSVSAIQVPLLRCPAGQAEQVLDVKVA